MLQKLISCAAAPYVFRQLNIPYLVVLQAPVFCPVIFGGAVVNQNDFVWEGKALLPGKQ